MPSRPLIAAACLVTACSSGASPPRSAPASHPAPVAVAIVFSGNEVWCGNEEHETDPALRYEGALDQLRLSFANGVPPAAFPPGSLATVISYADNVIERYAMGPARGLDAAAFGTQRDCRAAVGSQLMMGVDRAVDVLEATSARKRVLVIIGDGNDTNNQVAMRHFGDLETKLAREGIETYALLAPSALSPDDHIVSALTPHVERVASPGELPGRIAALWAQM